MGRGEWGRGRARGAGGTAKRGGGESILTHSTTARWQKIPQKKFTNVAEEKKIPTQRNWDGTLAEITVKWWYKFSNMVV